MRENEERLTREVMDRAIRRINIFEYLILGAAAVLALVGGALVAWVLSASLELSFRITWVVASLLFFVVPGGIVYLRERLNRSESVDVEQRREPGNGG